MADVFHSQPGPTGATGAGYLATSATSLVTAGAGSKAFTTQSGLAYSVGARVRATSRGTSEYMEGLVTAYSGTTLTIAADRNSGTGTHADWNLNLVGDVGATGATGATGVAYTPRNAYAGGTTYAQGDEVTDSSILYISLQSSNTGHTPASSPTWWQSVAGVSQWTTTGSSIAYNAGLVVIGSVGAPNETGLLNVAAQAPFQVSNTDFDAFTNTGTYATIRFGAATGNTYTRLQAFVGGGSSGGILAINPNGGNVGIGTAAPTAPLQVVGLPSYASNAAAITGGLTAGAFYRNGDAVCVVH